MQIKTKKYNADGLVRLETSGELKEIIIHEDFLQPNSASVNLCFKGKNSSGIVQMTLGEIRYLAREIEPKLAMAQQVKILKFEKESNEKPKKGKKR
jgi:hypothetical protein